jgi:hypothetical protein
MGLTYRLVINHMADFLKAVFIINTRSLLKINGLIIWYMFSIMILVSKEFWEPN